MTDSNVDRFVRLFSGNDRSFGVFNADTEEVFTEKARGPEPGDYARHIAGECGLGIVPIMDDATCRFGVIDVDRHGDMPDTNLKELELRIREADLPLTICRSKSGGAHLYLFASEPIPAKLLRTTLSKWASQLGHAGSEIFPKQNDLPGKGKNQQLGNWINLPYFKAADSVRWSHEGGKQIAFSHFLDIAESRRVSPAELVKKADGDHAEAPPCIQRMISEGVGHGQRNEALYNVVIYLKKMDPDGYTDRAHAINAKMFETPLSFSEAKKTIASAGRRDYKYRCGEEPCKKFCNSAVCVTRDYGITPSDKDELDVGADPANFDRLEKLMTEPVRWILHIDGESLILSTIELMDYRAVRRAVAERLTRIVAPMKNNKWEGLLGKLMIEAAEVEAPEEASTYGFLRTKLYDFLGRADLKATGGDESHRQALLLGNPVVQLMHGQRRAFFRGQDFVDYLKKHRSEEMKGTNLWVAMKRIGVDHTRIRVNGTPTSVWFVPLGDDDIINLNSADMEPEL